jgi:hypothetical protein
LAKENIIARLQHSRRYRNESDIKQSFDEIFAQNTITFDSHNNVVTFDDVFRQFQDGKDLLAKHITIRFFPFSRDSNVKSLER